MLLCVYSCKINGPAIKCNIFQFGSEGSQSVNSVVAGGDKVSVTSVMADGPARPPDQMCNVNVRGCK